MAQERGVKFDKLQVVDSAHLIADANVGKGKSKRLIPKRFQFDVLY